MSYNNPPVVRTLFPNLVMAQQMVQSTPEPGLALFHAFFIEKKGGNFCLDHQNTTPLVQTDELELGRIIQKTLWHLEVNMIITLL